MMGQQRHRVDDTQVICTSFQTNNHAAPHHSVFLGRMFFLTPTNSVEALKAHIRKVLQKFKQQVLLQVS